MSPTAMNRHPAAVRRRCSAAVALFTGLLAAAATTLAAAHSYGSHAAYGARAGAAVAMCRTNPGVHSFPLGDATFTVIADGFSDLPLSYQFLDSLEVIERVIKFTDTRPLGSLSAGKPVHATVGLLEYKGLNILFDAGGGEFIAAQGGLPAQLEVLGLTPSNIDHILISHLHFDHCGGLLVDPDGSELQFPNAKVHLAEEELAHWLQDDLVLTWGNAAQPEDLKDLVISVTRNVLSKIPEDKLVTFRVGDEVVPGVTATGLAPWHTPGSAILKILPDGAPQALYAIGDSVPLANIGIEAPWVRSAFDEVAEDGPAGKYNMLDVISAEGAWAFSYHAEFPAVAAIVKDGLGFRAVQPVPEPGLIGLTCAAQ